ncbi:hypothetical protein B7463_g11723, partial [Scytalidium lignicola]
MIAIQTTLLALVAVSQAHVVGWANGMYCKGGSNPAVDEENNDLATNPIFQETFENMWFQHDRGCDKAPPADGEFLELPAGGQVMLELAHNRGQTTLSFNGQFAGEWPDGKPHPEDWNGNNIPGEGCIQDDGAMHTSNQSTAAGTALAISYNSNLENVTLENLVVFSVLPNTPWKREAYYDIPAALPACPEDGCTCAWLWVPKGCGEPNIYMAGYKCKVTGATSTAPVGVVKAPTFCDNDPSKCQAGPKQMIIWNQAEANNVDVPAGSSPGYNMKNGFASGAQNDIFVTGPAPSRRRPSKRPFGKPA